MLLFAIVLSILLISSFTFLTYIWLTKKKYTRERFAFVGLAACIVVCTTAFASVNIGVGPWDLIAIAVSKIFGYEWQPQPLRIVDYVFVFAMTLILLRSIKSFHANWDGAKSVEQHRCEKLFEPRHWAVDGFAELQRLLRHQTLEIYEPIPKSHPTLTLGPSQPPLAWHLQACDLITLRYPYLSFNRREGWHGNEGCWIGKNRRSGHIVATRCSTSELGPEALAAFVSFVQGLCEDSSAELFIIEKAGTSKGSIPVGNAILVHETESSLLEGLADFSEYIANLNSRVREATLPDSSLTLADMYVPSNYRIGQSVTVQNDVESFLIEWVGDNTPKQIALLGEYGQGKTTAALMFAQRLVNESHACVPILLELRGKSPSNTSPEGLIAEWAAPYNINPNAVMKLLFHGRAVLILEGFDEMAQIGTLEARLEHFRTLWQFCRDRAKLLITGRPNLFLDDDEMKAALGIAPQLDAPYCEALHLVPFSTNQIEMALRVSDKETRAGIVQLAKSDPKFNDIVSRPSLLYIVGQLWKEHLADMKGEISSATVMRKFIQHSYRRQAEKLRLGGKFMVLNTGERDLFMKAIACQMAASGLPNQITKEQFERVVEALYPHVPPSLSRGGNTMLGEPTRPMADRMAELDDAVEVVKTDVRASGILVTDPSRSGALKFAHKSFMEFLVGAVAADMVVRSDQEANGALSSVTGFSVAKVLSVPEAVMFFAEVLGNAVRERNDREDMAAGLFRQIVVNTRSRVGALLVRLSVTIMLNEYRAQVTQGWRGAMWRTNTLLGAMMATMAFYTSWWRVYSIKTIDYTVSTVPTDAVGGALVFTIGTLAMALRILSSRNFGSTHARLALWFASCLVLRLSRESVGAVVGTQRVDGLQLILPEDFWARLAAYQTIVTIVGDTATVQTPK